MHAKKRVLIVDDHPSIRYLLRSLVETDDFTVCGEASGGLDGIQEAENLRPDVILLDFLMPGINGAQVASIVKKRMPDVRIILFTLDEDSVNKVLAATIGVDRVIAKPDGTTKLLQCMRDVVGLGPKESPTIGPLALHIDGMPKVNEIPSVGVADEESPV
jgi:two-component system chemotaxis response regulator CheY